MNDSWEIIAVSKEGLPQMDPAFMGGNGYDPVNELMRAIILRTIEDINSSTEFYQEALDYLLAEEEEYIFSFRAICKHLGFDPERTRFAILNADHRISTRRRAA